MSQGGPRKPIYNSIMRLNTRTLTTIMTSAYLSAMLTSSMSPMRSSSIFAAAVDPSGPQRAFKDVVSGLDADDWAAAVAGTPVPVPPAPTSVPVDPAPKTEPAITEELMARLITRTLASKKPKNMEPKVRALFGFTNGPAEIPIKQVSEVLPEGKHFFIATTNDGGKDIVLGFLRADQIYGEYYLTDKTGVLRAAGIMDSTGSRLITNESAAAKYKAELQLFAKLAKDLPPTGTAVAGNS